MRSGSRPERHHGHLRRRHRRADAERQRLGRRTTRRRCARSPTATPTGPDPTTGPRTIGFQVNDGAASNNLSNVASRTVNVNPNPPPVAGAVSATTDKNTAIDINVLASASDPDGDSLHVASVNTTGTKGTVSINPDGTIHYDPNGQFSSLQQGQTATDTFTYQVSDGYHDSNSATVTVTITGVNNPPVLSNIERATLQYDAGTPAVPVTASLTVSSPDTTTLAGATVTISSGLVRERGLARVHGPERDHRQLQREHRGADADRQRVGRGLPGGAALGHLQRRQRPDLDRDTDDQLPGQRWARLEQPQQRRRRGPSTSNPNTPAERRATSPRRRTSTRRSTSTCWPSASDPDGDVVSLVSVDTTGTKGSVSINSNGTVHYDPTASSRACSAGQTATDTFTYTVSDGYSTATGKVTVTITGVNDPPVLSNIESGALSYRAQDPAVQITSALTVSDDDDATMSGATVSITSGFSSGDGHACRSRTRTGSPAATTRATGVLTLSGNASLADYQAALRSVEFCTSDSSTTPAGADGLLRGHRLGRAPPARRPLSARSTSARPTSRRWRATSATTRSATRRSASGRARLRRGDGQRQPAKPRQRSRLRRPRDAHRQHLAGARHRSR